MKLMQALLRGFRGHPIHPPLTDITIGAYTVATLVVLLGWAGLAERRLASFAYAAIVVALISSVLTVVTGLADYLRIPRGTPLRRTAAIHWVVMVWATAVFLVAAVLLRNAYETSHITLAAALVTVAGWLTMTFGAWVGGTIVFVHGMRVLKERDVPTGQALKPHLPPD